MVQSDVSPDRTSFNAAISACENLRGDVEHVSQTFINGFLGFGVLDLRAFLGFVVLDSRVFLGLWVLHF